jgi:hypothetical protein
LACTSVGRSRTSTCGMLSVCKHSEECQYLRSWSRPTVRCDRMSVNVSPCPPPLAEGNRVAHRCRSR